MIVDSGCYVDMWARGVGLHVSSYETHLMKLKIVIQKRSVISSFFCFGLTSLTIMLTYETSLFQHQSTLEPPSTFYIIEFSVTCASRF